MTAGPTAGWPEVTMAGVHADQQFFYAHPARRYWTRPASDGRGWVIRRRGRNPPVFLRALLAPGVSYPDTDEALRQAWFRAAYPGLSPGELDELVESAKTVEPPVIRRR